jgi:hypothetical protein
MILYVRWGSVVQMVTQPAVFGERYPQKHFAKTIFQYCFCIPKLNGVSFVKETTPDTPGASRATRAQQTLLRVSAGVIHLRQSPSNDCWGQAGVTSGLVLGETCLLKTICGAARGAFGSPVQWPTSSCNCHSACGAMRLQQPVAVTEHHLGHSFFCFKPNHTSTRRASVWFLFKAWRGSRFPTNSPRRDISKIAPQK